MTIYEIPAPYHRAHTEGIPAEHRDALLAWVESIGLNPDNISEEFTIYTTKSKDPNVALLRFTEYLRDRNGRLHRDPTNPGHALTMTRYIEIDLTTIPKEVPLHDMTNSIPVTSL